MKNKNQCAKSVSRYYTIDDSLQGYRSKKKQDKHPTLKQMLAEAEITERLNIESLRRMEELEESKKKTAPPPPRYESFALCL